jgi:hypothetical protein
MSKLNMMVPRVYIDTSVIGGCLDVEFSPWSIRLLEEVERGEKIAVISDLMRKELKAAPDAVQKILNELPTAHIENLFVDAEANALAEKYIQEGGLTEKSFADAQHIATATINRVDILVSWNFKHIVNLNRIHIFQATNLKQGYPIVEIRSPREVLNEET